MKRLALAILLAAACTPVPVAAVSPTPAAPQTAIAAPSPSPSPTPTPCPRAGTADDLVVAKQVAAEFAHQLVDVPLAQGETVTRAFAGCFSVARVSNVEPAVLAVSRLGGLSGNEGIVVYYAAGHWRAAPLVTSTGSAPGGGEYSVATPLLATVAADGFDLLAKGYIPSAGAGEQRFELFHLAADAQLVWSSPRRYSCGDRSRVVSADVLLETWTERTPDPATFADYAGGCPAGWTQEVLWQRQGATFAQAAMRTVPSAAWTLVYFVGALQAGNTALARSYATSDAVVSAVSAFARDPQLATPPDLLTDEAAEANAWEALPPSERGQLPASQRDMDLGTHVLRLERIGGLWRVTAVVK